MRSVHRKVASLVMTVLLLGMSTIGATAALADDASTADRTADHSGEQLSVVGVTATTHDGYDRLTFEIGGEGQAGYLIGYDDEPRSQGSGFLVDLDGDVALGVTIRSVLLPPEAPADLQPFLDDLAGPEGGVVLEVVNDTIFEGHHTFFVGLDAELPFRVERLEDPQRVVVELVHADDGEEEPPVPVDGVETGQGGATRGSPLGPVVLGLGVVLVALGGGALVRRRSGT
jgi:hypothetical protein